MNESFLQKFLDCNDTPPYVYGGMRKYFSAFESKINQSSLTKKLEDLCGQDNIVIIYSDELVTALADWKPPGSEMAQEFKDVPNETCLAITYSVDIRTEAWREHRPFDEQTRGLFIYMRPPVNESVAFNILLHECCHVGLEHIQSPFPLHEAEAEAELAACLVRYDLGIDTSPLSFEYINHFAKAAQVEKRELVNRKKIISLVEELSKALHE